MKKILIIKHGALGDVILSMHSVFAIWKHFKGYEISVLTESKYKELFQCLPFIQNIKIDNRPKIYYFLKYIKIFKWFYESDFERYKYTIHLHLDDLLQKYSENC